MPWLAELTPSKQAGKWDVSLVFISEMQHLVVVKSIEVASSDYACNTLPIVFAEMLCVPLIAVSEAVNVVLRRGIDAPNVVPRTR